MVSTLFFPSFYFVIGVYVNNIIDVDVKPIYVIVDLEEGREEMSQPASESDFEISLLDSSHSTPFAICI